MPASIPFIYKDDLSFSPSVPRCLLLDNRRKHAHASAVRNGVLARVKDSDIATPVLEISGTNSASNAISCPADKSSVLGITLPVFVMFVKAVRGCLWFVIGVNQTVAGRR